MRTNANITVYNITTVNRVQVFYLYQLYGVAWESRIASNKLATGGSEAADKAYIYIPMSLTGYVEPVKWQSLSGKSAYWTLQQGDVIVRNAIEDYIDSNFTLTNLKEKYGDDVMTIRSVDRFDNGSKRMWHWKVGAS